MERKKDGKLYFCEYSSLWPGQAFSLEVEEVLYEGKSKFQDILVFKSATWGRVLVLDGVIQLTEKDECAYQEMLAHSPLMAHGNPNRVLIVGGGDGGIAREVLKHESVEKVDMCEIDEDVIKVSKEFLPFTASSFSHSKLTLHMEDGLEFLKRHSNEYDVIITDSSDPIGPAETLYGDEYSKALHGGLREGGITAMQCESIWIHMPIIKGMVEKLQQYFQIVDYSTFSIPTYPCGCIGIIFGCKGNIPVRKSQGCAIEGLKYYSSELHNASFVLPEFARKGIGIDI